MPNLLAQDPRFGLTGNATFQQGLRTVNQLLDPVQGQVSVLPRLQTERDVLAAERAKSDAFKGDLAATGLQGSKIQGVLDEALGASADTQLAGAEFEEAQAQEDQDRLALGAYLSLVLEPQITGRSLNVQESALKTQLEQLRKARRNNDRVGTLKIIGGIILIVATAGAAAPVGVGLIASGAEQRGRG